MGCAGPYAERVFHQQPAAMVENATFSTTGQKVVHMRKWWSGILATLIGLATLGTSWAQSTLGPTTYRVGNAVLYAMVDTSSESLFISSTFLVGCDGTWGTTHFSSYLGERKSLTLGEMQDQAWKSLSEPTVGQVQFVALDRKRDAEGKEILARVQRLCKLSPPVPRNLLIPIAGTKDEVSSLMTGTVTRKGTTIEAWTSDAKFREEPPAAGGGPARKVFTGEVTKARLIYNCTERTAGILALIAYDASGGTLENSERTLKDVIYRTVIPGSALEQRFDFLCKVF